MMDAWIKEAAKLATVFLDRWRAERRGRLRISQEDSEFIAAFEWQRDGINYSITAAAASQAQALVDLARHVEAWGTA